MKRSTNCSVNILPSNICLIAVKGALLIDVLREAEILIEAPCGGKGTCGKCNVLVAPHNIVGELPIDESFSMELSCRYIINTDITVKVLEDSKSNKRKDVLVESETFQLNEARIRKHFLTLAPQKYNLVSDQETISRELVKLKIGYPDDLEILRIIPDVMRKEDYKITVVSHLDEVINIEEGNTTCSNYGVAFDIGTTTIVGTLIDLYNGISLGSESSDNPQRTYGADVISRLAYLKSENNGLWTLHRIIIKAVNEIIGKLVTQYKLNREHIYAVSFLGNTTMMHLLLNINPRNLAESPYLPAYKFANCVKAKELGIKINDNGRCVITPNIGGFVGADTVGAVLATNIYDSEKMNLMIDIGTNGEIVLGSKDKGFYSCSTAAGPAFEGAQIKFGTRAIPGAIEKIKFTDDVKVHTIGNVPPIGICGSGLIDCVAELLKLKIINSKGSMSNCFNENLPEKISRRIISVKNEMCFVLSYKEENPLNVDIVLTQKDIRQVQLAKGSIFAGIKIMQKLLDVSDDEINEIKLAGAFGSYISKESALIIGMLPALDINKIVVVGNAAGAGAQKILLSDKYYQKSMEIAKGVEYIELSTSLNFTNEFIKALSFPATIIE